LKRGRRGGGVFWGGEEVLRRRRFHSKGGGGNQFGKGGKHWDNGFEKCRGRRAREREDSDCGPPRS